MYKQNKMVNTCLGSTQVTEGERIEHKVARILSNNEPITDGAPEIYTDKADGVGAQYNVRTDRWELATEATELRLRNEIAKGSAKAEAEATEKEAKVVKLEPKTDGKAEGTNGTTDK
jgi:hypothetical protein